MKKSIQLLLFVVIIITSLTTTSFKKATNDWGNWTSPNARYDGIEVRVRRGDYNNYAKKWQWDLQFRNRYNKKVTFQYGCTASNDRNSCRTEQRTSLDANETEGNDDVRSFLLNEVNTVYVCLDRVEFGN